MKVEGYKCDIDGCPSFSRDRAGWIPLTRYDQEGLVQTDPEAWAEACSPACAVKFWRQTIKAEEAEELAETDPPVVVEAESLEHQAKLAVLARRNGQPHIRQRVTDGSYTEAEHAHKHKAPSQKVRSCVWCEREKEEARRKISEANPQVQ